MWRYIERHTNTKLPENIVSTVHQSNLAFCLHMHKQLQQFLPNFLNLLVLMKLSQIPFQIQAYYILFHPLTHLPILLLSNMPIYFQDLHHPTKTQTMRLAFHANFHTRSWLANKSKPNKKDKTKQNKKPKLLAYVTTPHSYVCQTTFLLLLFFS